MEVADRRPEDPSGLADAACLSGRNDSRAEVEAQPASGIAESEGLARARAIAEVLGLVTHRLAISSERVLEGLSRLSHMHMEVLPAWLDSVCMLLILELDRNRNQSPVAHTALGNDTPGEVPHVARRTFQNGDLQTTVVVQMHVHRCHRQIMAVVERSHQSLRQLPLPMIINIGEGGDGGP